jgi:hypothetical protein
VGGDVDAGERAVVEAFSAPGAERTALTAEESEAGARLLRERYSDPAWHAGPWADVTPDAVRAVLGA